MTPIHILFLLRDQIQDGILGIIEKAGILDDRVSVKPNIDNVKMDNAINSYAKGVFPENVLLLYDDTIFRGAGDGLLITTHAIYFKEGFEDGIFFEFKNLLEISDFELSFNKNNELFWVNKQDGSTIHLYKGCMLDHDDFEKLFCIIIATVQLLREIFISLEHEKLNDEEDVKEKNEDREEEEVKRKRKRRGRIKVKTELETLSRYKEQKEEKLKELEELKKYKQQKNNEIGFDENKEDIEVKESVVHNESIQDKENIEIKEAVGEKASIENKEVMDDNETSEYNGAKKHNEFEKIDSSINISDKFMGMIANFKEYAVAIVYLLKNNAPDKILSIVSKMPVIGGAGMIGRFVLNKPLAWLNEQLVNSGEPYIMNKLVGQWNEKNIQYIDIKEGINKIPNAIFDDDQKQEIIILLNKYYIDQSAQNIININASSDVSNIDLVVCPKCSSKNSKNSKFCSECGAKIIVERKCPKCGAIVSENAKFCCECGSSLN